MTIVKKIKEIIYKYESWQTFKESKDNKNITFKQWLDIEEKDKMKVKLENQAIIQKDLQFCKKVDLPLKSESELLSSTLFLDTKKTESNPDMVGLCCIAQKVINSGGLPTLLLH
ncbi:hypothetical protein AVM71_16920 (plasmid) [Piscirickettsia salmonis]|nr:hypothetical protein AVM71_16920 [Piscirickettsia salmonis]